MNSNRMSREERESLYIRKMTELQRRWGNPIDDDWSHVKDCTDEELNEGLRNTVGQLRFEKGWSSMRTLINWVFYGFILLGIFGLLLFGIRQIF